MERVIEEISFTASDRSGETIRITSDYVDERLSDVFESEDMSQYIL